MLYPRIIPTLLIRNKGLVKTVKFKDSKYIGDPLNAVKIFNEKEVDELIVLDIDATTQNKDPDYNVIESMAAECRMPLCYGGGIKSGDQAQRIFSLGVEKIAISSEAIKRPAIVADIANKVGSQSTVVVLDVKKNYFSKKYTIYTQNGRKSTGIDPVIFSRKVEELGAGELVINSIDNDGMMKGYDLTLINSIVKSINIPLTALGGAGSMHDIESLIKEHKIIGAGAGSLFVFKGKFKAVLINYPSEQEKMDLMKYCLLDF